jgi:hypothetical protein
MNKIVLNKRLGDTDIIVRKMLTAPAWVITTQYYTGDIVSNGGIGQPCYKAKQNSLGQPLTNSTYWENLGADDTVMLYIADLYDAGTDIRHFNATSNIFYNKVKCNTSLQVGNDTTTITNDGTEGGKIRYREDTNASYIDVLMKTGTSTYQWVNVKTNTW